jgi:hypothetical protein
MLALKWSTLERPSFRVDHVEAVTYQVGTIIEIRYFRCMYRISGLSVKEEITFGN